MHLMNINSPLFSVQVLNTAHIQLLLYDEDLMPQKKCFKQSLTCHVTSNRISQIHNKNDENHV